MRNSLDNTELDIHVNSPCFRSACEELKGKSATMMECGVSLIGRNVDVSCKQDCPFSIFHSFYPTSLPLPLIPSSAYIYIYIYNTTPSQRQALIFSLLGALYNDAPVKLTTYILTPYYHPSGRKQ